MSEPKVSVIVSNFNGLKFLPRLVETLSAQRGVEMELIIVDRHSSDGSAEWIAGNPGIKLVSLPPEAGLVSGYHAGVPKATADLFFFANEDMWFDPDCMRLLAEKIDIEARIGAADPWQWTYDGRECVHAGVRFERSRWTGNSPYPFRRNEFVAQLPDGALIPFPCAAGVMIHRAMYEDCGGWDTTFFLDWEDSDLWLRAWQRGWKTVTTPSARDYHAVGASNAQTLAGGRDTVSRRRYLSNRTSIAVIALKTFSSPGLVLAGLGWLSTPFTNLLKGRWNRLWLDLRAFGVLWERLPHALAFRKANLPYIRRRPGEKFFIAPQFNG